MSQKRFVFLKTFHSRVLTITAFTWINLDRISLPPLIHIQCENSCIGAVYRATAYYAKTRYWRSAKAAGAANLRLKVANSRIESFLYLCLKFVGSSSFKRNLFTALEWQQINHLTNAWTVYIRGWSPPLKPSKDSFLESRCSRFTFKKSQITKNWI